MFIDNLSICPQIACLLSVMFAVEYFITQKKKDWISTTLLCIFKRGFGAWNPPKPVFQSVCLPHKFSFHLLVCIENRLAKDLPKFLFTNLLLSSRYFVQYNCLERIKVNAIYNDKDINATLLHFPPNSAPHLTI